MNALGACLGGLADRSRIDLCADLFADRGSLKTLALDGAGVFAFVAPPGKAVDVGSAAYEGLSVLADARIDARGELARALGLDLARASAASAAELIARAWRRWGVDAPGRLVGDYAFLAWDPEDRSLYMVRDYVGGRPLHYRAIGQGLLVASLPSVLARAAGPAEVDAFTLARYHALLPQTGPESFFRGVRRVEPATIVRWRDGKIVIRRYWHPPPGELRIGRQEAAEQVSAILKEAVRDRSDGAGGIAAHLSSGMDSSAVAASLGDCGIAATMITGEERSQDPAPAGYTGSESPAAAATAALYPSLRHCVACPEPVAIVDTMDAWNRTLDQPVRSIDNAAWLGATYGEAAAAGATVLMTGSFGNNSFSHDGTAIFADLLRRGRLGSLVREARLYRAASGARWRGIGAFALGPAIPASLWRWYRKQPDWRTAMAELTLFRPGHRLMDELRERARGDGQDLAQRPLRSPWHARAQELQWVDNGLFDFGVRQRWGVTLTDPTADRRLVEFTLQLPAGHWIEDGRTRALARRVLEGRVAPEVLDPPARGMQGRGWRATMECCLPQLRDEVRRLHGTEWGEMLDLVRIDRMLERWPTDGWSDYQQLFLYQASLLRAISMGHFARVRSA